MAIRKINPGETAEITLSKKDRGFGFSIRGGEGISLHVLRVPEGGAAYEDGRLKVRYLIVKFFFLLVKRPIVVCSRKEDMVCCGNRL